MLQHLTQSRISLRLPVLVVLALVVSIAASSGVFYSLFADETRQRTEEYARTLAEHAEANVSTWLEAMHLTVEDLAEGQLAPQAMRAFNEALALQAPGWLEELHTAYAGAADTAGVESRPAYDIVHAAFHPALRAHLDRFDYADLLLITESGDVIYSLAKGAEFATNLQDGPFADSLLARAWRQALAAPAGDDAATDIAPYAGNGGAPAAFIARRIADGQAPGAPLLGVVAIRLSNAAAEAALAGTGDLAELDEIYLVGEDGRARSASRLGTDFALLDTLPDLPQIALAREGGSGYLPGVQGLHGREVDAAVVSFRAFGASVSAIVELDHATAFAALGTFTRQAAIFMTLGILLSLAVGYLVARSITRPLAALTGSMDRLSDEDYDTAVAGTTRHDEIGLLARGLDRFREKLAAAQEARALQAAARIEQEKVVGDLGRGLRDLASGHLDIRLEEPYAQGYEQLRADFNETVDTMERLMRAISANAAEIRARAEEISASSDDLSHRTENQAATLEETAAALDQLTSSVRSAADSASEVERVVADARKEAEQSGEVVAEAVSAMALIRKSSNEISQIIGVIDDIAFQTNLLALNAGVEAARAGDAGRGFAVVASEVRALAQRSSEAAKQIKTLITGSSQQVETGAGLVGRAGETLGMIIDRVGNIDRLVGGIASGAREQSSGLGEINLGVSQLDQVTQQNAAMVEEVTAAAMTLKNESAALSQIVTRFRLRDEAAPGLNTGLDPLAGAAWARDGGFDEGLDGDLAQVLRADLSEDLAFALSGEQDHDHDGAPARSAAVIPAFDAAHGHDEDAQDFDDFAVKAPLPAAANMVRWQDF